MSAAREKDQADFDLEAFIDLFDEALTSDDPSVQKTLQHLMVIAALARNHDGHGERRGPLRRLFEDQRNILRRLESLEMNRGGFQPGFGPTPPFNPAPMPSIPSVGPTIWPQSPTVAPNTGTPNPPWNNIWYGAKPTSVSASGFSVGATGAGDTIAERVEALLKDPKYKGSSIGADDGNAFER